ncbi:DUF4376 domain-containing protein [Aminobacter sp. MDW-2]|uniref:DUF4376 domain-containing protein n=1 Tax=Aminobacter sp. MDW-2 TaxID=2666139 RepID=UPI0012B07C5F|nr:DUF4376 domain-containing protein [Aminobacter sp. MDW-2]MRX32804.1 DUF4376 domain-containing protein [Aminobacter sp. MDW-2]QNH34535.1 DUF4376 domain-containing protein [Aminobacter sp. MDW-2]
MYTNPRVMNELGGILVDHAEGTAYLDPGSELHDQAIAGAFGVVEAYSPVPIAATLDEWRARKLASLAAKRWEVENGGMVVGGMAVFTDDRSKLLINGAYRKAEKDPAVIINFKSAAGWVTLDAATAIALGDALFDHIQASFDRESVLTAAIVAAATKPALDAIDINGGWPANG